MRFELRHEMFFMHWWLESVIRQYRSWSVQEWTVSTTFSVAKIEPPLFVRGSCSCLAGCCRKCCCMLGGGHPCCPAGWWSDVDLGKQVSDGLLDGSPCRCGFWLCCLNGWQSLMVGICLDLRFWRYCRSTYFRVELIFAIFASNIDARILICTYYCALLTWLVTNFG